MAENKKDVAELVRFAEHFQRRVLQDAMAHATAEYWRRRAQEWESCRPRPGDRVVDEPLVKRPAKGYYPAPAGAKSSRFWKPEAEVDPADRLRDGGYFPPNEPPETRRERIEVDITACRNAAELALVEGRENRPLEEALKGLSRLRRAFTQLEESLPPPPGRVICPVCGTPTSPWTCSCGATRVGEAA